MTSKHRVFSHALDINYVDYTKNKKGVEMLKPLKIEYNKIHKYEQDTEIFKNINRFKNYDEFLNMSRSYFNYIDEECRPEFVKNLYNANISYVEKDLFDDDNNITKVCKEEDLYLYPYGVLNDNKNCVLLYPYKIDISKWCTTKETICPLLFNETYPICPPQPQKQQQPIVNNSYQPILQEEPPSQSNQQHIAILHNVKINKDKVKNNCDKCKTLLCKRGLCNNCNKKENKCHCHETNNVYSQLPVVTNTNIISQKRIKKLKTGVSF